MVVRCGTVQHGTVRCGMVQHGTVRCDTVQRGTVRYISAQCGAVRCGAVIAVVHEAHMDPSCLVKQDCAWACRAQGGDGGGDPLTSLGRGRTVPGPVGPRGMTVVGTEPPPPMTLPCGSSSGSVAVLVSWWRWAGGWSAVRPVGWFRHEVDWLVGWLDGYAGDSMKLLDGVHSA